MKRTLIAALAIVIATTAFAERGGRQRGPQRDRGEGSPAAVAEVLDLSDAQKTQARTLRESLRTTVEPLREQLRANRDAVRAAVDAGNAQQAGELLVAGKAVRDQIKAARDQFETQFAAMLNEDQKAKWATLQDMRDARRGQREHDDD